MADTRAADQITDDDDNKTLPVIYALIWRSNATDDEFDQAEFHSRIPRLMEWLKKLRNADKLVACGGGGFANHAAGLTLIRADNVDEALELSTGSPMNEIGTTELMVWDVFYADLTATANAERLQ